jgi:hypothetical protein
VAVAGVVFVLVRRTFDDVVEYEVSAAEAKRLDAHAGKAVV